MQKLDGKTMQRLETAVSKSEYSQGKKLKVVPKVFLHCKRVSPTSTDALPDQPRYQGRPHCRDWRADHRSKRFLQDRKDEQALDGYTLRVYVLDFQFT